MPLLTSSRIRQLLPYLAGTVAAGLILPALSTMSTDPGPPASLSGPEAIARQFCTPVPAAARVTPAQAAAVEVHVAVPEREPAVNASSRPIVARRGQVVRIAVASSTDGAVGVHGMSDIVPVRAGQTASLAFRLIYSGRFPLHFHGVDGAHFEILALEIHD